MCFTLESLGFTSLGVKANLPGNPTPAPPVGPSPILSCVGSCRWEGELCGFMLTDLEGEGEDPQCCSVRDQCPARKRIPVKSCCGGRCYWTRRVASGGGFRSRLMAVQKSGRLGKAGAHVKCALPPHLCPASAFPRRQLFPNHQHREQTGQKREGEGGNPWALKVLTHRRLCWGGFLKGLLLA